ncbi:DUF732 domain-containing protein [Mycolicibacterium goodii]|uniref:DUF732 domain-containing protein n=1 Tax=Mycolicibacterium goodii TaxID=134601 RepID=UPI001FEE1062|nr:DUF732 domain-containing protein [Mycolicibacterium goodii]ULN46860.1 DUF732 domain-containing protein [Mycolicibacterium goodii]
MKARRRGIAMFFGRRTVLAISAAAVAVGMTAGIAPAHASVEDDRYLAIVEQLKVPGSAEAAIQVGHEICNAMEAGKIEPARTVRGVISHLMNQAGISKGQAAGLVRGAVSVYCPQYTSLVGR